MNFRITLESIVKGVRRETSEGITGDLETVSLGLVTPESLILKMWIQ